MPTEGFDPVRWAEAAGLLARNPALYVFVGLLALFILCKWWPGRKRDS